MDLFTETLPTTENYWRSVILFGVNSASYKFSLAKSLLELAEQGKTHISIEELSGPYSRYITEHLKFADRQGTSRSSQFIDVCRKYNVGELVLDELIDTTVKLGFNNVLDAFHIVNRGELPVKFFEVNKEGRQKGIIITDSLLKLKEDSLQFNNLPLETEARWRLVETAWEMNISSNLLRVERDQADELLYIQTDANRRVDITSSRDALNGYQKGKCFYCYRDISVETSSDQLADVDHFFPHVLKQHDEGTNFDGVWNLVLACKECNRGEKGKSARLPKTRYLERLHMRNSFLIDSHHPLRETLIAQTGHTEEQRRNYLQEHYNHAKINLIHEWEPIIELPPSF